MSDAPLKRIEARFYQLASGREPVRQWLLSLSDSDRKSMVTIHELLNLAGQ